MASKVDWHWGLSNIGEGALRIWLEPWAEEYWVSSRSTLTVKIKKLGSDNNFVAAELVPEGLVVFSDEGDAIELCIDGFPRNSENSSATLSLRDFLGERPPPLWQKLKWLFSA